MLLKAYKNIGDPQPIIQEVNVVVIEGKHGQPIVVAADCGNGQIMAEVAKPDTEIEFNRILQTLGIDKVVIVDDLSKHLVPMSQQSEMPHILGAK